MCIALGILGIALCIAGMLLGATMEAVRGTFGISGMKNFWESSGSVVDVETLVENHDAGSESGSGDGYGDSYPGRKFSDIRELEIDVTCLEVYIAKWGGSEILADTDNVNQEILDDFVMTGKDGELKIELKNRNKWEKMFQGAYCQGTLFLQIPADLQFEKAKIQVGAGVLKADDLRAEELEIQVGAGEVYLDSFQAQEMDLECGAGEAVLYGDALREAKIECGVGTVRYTASGSQEDYNYEVECGIGSVTVGGDTYSGLGSEHKIHNGGSKKMEIECGIGLVDVSFDG